MKYAFGQNPGPQIMEIEVVTPLNKSGEWESIELQRNEVILIFSFIDLILSI